MGVARVGDMSSGHDACSPVPIVSGAGTVFVNKIPAARLGDPLSPHGCFIHPVHSGVVASGSSTVFVEGKPLARSGDTVSCGGVIIGGSNDVNAN